MLLTGVGVIVVARQGLRIDSVKVSVPVWAKSTFLTIAVTVLSPTRDTLFGNCKVVVVVVTTPLLGSMPSAILCRFPTVSPAGRLNSKEGQSVD